MSNEMSMTISAVTSISMVLIAVFNSWLAAKKTTAPDTAFASTITQMQRRRLRSINIGLVSLLLALFNLASYCFGPQREMQLTAGIVASMFNSLVMAMSGLYLMRPGES
jgi:hypothetical protein